MPGAFINFMWRAFYRIITALKVTDQYFYLLFVSFQIIVVMATLTLFGFGLYGLLQLDQNFDPDWFLPRDSDEILFRQNFRTVSLIDVC